MKKFKTLLTVTLLCLSTGAAATGSRLGDPAESSSLYDYFISFFTSESAPEASSSSEE